MNLDDIALFLQVVASGTLSGAAKVLQRPKASVSHQLKRLEQELGAELFIRTPNALLLSKAGRELVPHAQLIKRSCEQAKDAALQWRKDATSELKIASSSEFASNIMSSILMQFSREAPQFRINATTFQRDMLPEVREHYDCIIYLDKPPLPQFSDMKARMLGSFRYMLYASPAYLAKRGAPAHPDQLNEFDLLAWHARERVAPWTLESADGSVSIDPSANLVSNDHWIIKLAAIHDHGVCRLPSFFARLEENSGMLRRVLTDWASAEIPVYALYWSHRFANPNLATLLDRAEKGFRELDNYLYAGARRDEFSKAASPSPGDG